MANKTENLDYFPFNHEKAIRRGMLCLVPSPVAGNRHCGYTAFRSSWLPRAWRGNYNADALQYLAIHGGLTYACEESGWSVFGFDCTHSGDDEISELGDIDYVFRLTATMRQQIIAYRAVIKKWRKAKRKGRARLLDKVIQSAAEMTSTPSFGAMIGMLSGAPEFGES